MPYRLAIAPYCYKIAAEKSKLMKKQIVRTTAVILFTFEGFSFNHALSDISMKKLKIEATMRRMKMIIAIKYHLPFDAGNFQP